MELYDSGSTADLNRLADARMALLQKNRLTVATTESCTGGMLFAKLVDIPGISEVSREGYTTYSDKAKRRLLNISETTLRKYDAMNAQTARGMTTSAVFAANADVAVSATSIAGPNGGDGKKLVGLVFIGCYMNDCVTVEGCRFQGDRIAVRIQVMQSALRLLRATVLENIKV